MMQEDGPLKSLSLVVGSAELPLLRKQTADFAGHRARLGLPVTYEEISGENHFTILYEMMSPKGRITTLIGSCSSGRRVRRRRHCEERSDDAIHTSSRDNGLLRFARNDGGDT